MIKSTFGLKDTPFYRDNFELLPQQQDAFNYLKIHSQHGGFSAIIGEPGVGKSALKERIEMLGEERENVVASVTRTMHTYWHILNQLAISLKLEVKNIKLEQALIEAAYKHVKNNKTLFVLIDEAHLLDMSTLRKLRLLFDKFPKKYNLVLFGQIELMHYLSMTINEDLKSRITYSKTILRLSEDDLAAYITRELEAVRLGVNVFDEAATELIIRSSQGNLRLCRNLCYASLATCCQHQKRVVLISHVNEVLIQPHWRSHDELIKQQVA
jgi:MSHA biogenesis protein MshM